MNPYINPAEGKDKGPEVEQPDPGQFLPEKQDHQGSYGE